MLRKLPAHLTQFTLFFACLLMIVPEGRLLAGGLAVSPQRLSFEGRTRTAEVLLRTNGSETQTYRLSLVEMDMPEEGALKMVDKPAPDRMSARKLIRFSPRQVVLRPGETQVIRVRVRKPGGLKDGEYRSHLLFQNVPETNNDIERQIENKPTFGTEVRIVPIYGVAIPVTVRHGELSAEASLSELKLINTSGKPADSQTLSMILGRSGNRSVHGDLRVLHQQPGGSTVEVGRLNGVSVYTPGKRRRANVNLAVPAGRKLSAGTLTVEYRTKAKYGGELLASSSMTLGRQ